MHARQDDMTPSPEMLTVEVATTLEHAEAAREDWDALAVAARCPYGAPGWLLEWWRCARPAGAELRVVLVRGDDGLIAVAPLFAQSRADMTSYAFLCSDITAQIEPVCVPGSEAVAAESIAHALAAMSPPVHALTFAGAHEDSIWPSLLAGAWPSRRRAWLHRRLPIPAPRMRLSGMTPDAWLSSKSSNFRQQMRRGRRQLEEQGARWRRTERDDELDRDIAELARLHHSRWDSRGGSGAMKPGVEEMLRAAGRDLLARGRFHLHVIDVGDRAISAHLFIEAGGVLSYWLGGFDDEWARYRPALLSVLDAVEHAMERGEAAVDLGPGAQPYKYRFADDEVQLEWITLVPRGRAYPLVRLRLLPMELRWALSRRLSGDLKQRLQRIVRRGQR
jgi:CelD/BcsL family acetyltransferase involved in cellulose biosynthesis